MVYYIVFGVIFCFCLVINFVMRSKLNKYFDVKTKLSGFEAIKKFLSDTDKKDLYVVTTKDSISNYYDVGNRSIKLSNETFNEEDVVNVGLAILVCSDSVMGNAIINLRNKLYKYINYVIRLCFLLIILCFLIKEEQFCYAAIVVYVVLFVFSLLYFVMISKNVDKVCDKCSKLGFGDEVSDVINILKYREFSLYIETLFKF